VSDMSGVQPAARWRVVASLGIVYVIWGSTYLAIRFADETLPPILMAATRFLVAGTLLYVWLRARGAPRPTRRQWGAALVVGALLLLGGNGGVVWAEQYVASGVVALLVATVPLWMTVFDWLRPGGIRPSMAVVAGLVCGFGGVALLISPTSVAGGGRINLGAAVVVLVAAMCWAAGSLYSRSGKLPEAALMGTAIEMLAGGGLMLVLGTLLGEWSTLHIQAISARSLLGLAYLVVFGSLIAYSAYIWMLRHTTTAVASTYAYVNPVVAVLLGWLFDGEALSARTLLAAAVIVAGVVIITTFQARARLHARGVPSAEAEPNAVARSR
jgi:drug/metabolite transporter (DMT)-like permease